MTPSQQVLPLTTKHSAHSDLPIQQRMPNASVKKPTVNRVASYLRQFVPPDTFLEVELMILAMAAGINDAATFPDYRVFASNQTGNTALLAVGALRLVPELVDLRDVAFSLGMFVLGGFILGQLGHRLGRTRRAWLLLTNVFQTSLVFAAAAIRKWVPTEIDDPPRYAVIALLAFASGGQVAMARTVNIPEITTAMVTSAYIDFLVDAKLLSKHNRSRNRRGLFVLALLTGSFIGAAGYKYVGAAFALLLAATSKLGVCIMLTFNRGQEEE